MGRGDKRSRKGKVYAGSYGKTRPKPKNKRQADKKEGLEKTKTEKSKKGKTKSSEKE